MQCELCGSIIRGPPKTVRIEGATLRVCGNCATYGTEVPGERNRKITPGGAPRPSVQQTRRRPRDVFDLIEGEIVDDYYDRIRKARMSRGLSQKELALRIKEREILIKKIEKGDLIPEDDVRKKLEEVLEIRLIDSPDAEARGTGGGKITTTFGDLINIKKK